MARWACCLAVLSLLGGCMPDRPETGSPAVAASPAPPKPRPWAIEPLRAKPPEPPRSADRGLEAPTGPTTRPAPREPSRGPAIAAEPTRSAAAKPPAPHRKPEARRPASAAGSRSPLPYPACPAIALSYCLGELRPAAQDDSGILSPEQVKTLRRCELDIYARALASLGRDVVADPTALDVIGNHCAAHFLRTRSIEAARERLGP